MQFACNIYPLQGSLTAQEDPQDREKESSVTAPLVCVDKSKDNMNVSYMYMCMYMYRSGCLVGQILMGAWCMMRVIGDILYVLQTL